MNIRSEILKEKSLDDFGFFVRYMFKEIYGIKFIVKDFHLTLFDVINRIVKGQLTNVIINIPPRFGKTEILVKMFITYGFLINIKSKFIHISNGSLALDNSTVARSYVKTKAFQNICPCLLSKESDAKGHWKIQDGGEVYATSSGGEVIGYGAGLTQVEDYLDYMFGGAFIIDDPIKAQDIYSDVIRTKINERYNSTFRSRRNNPKVPFIVIMQRLHEDDFTGYLLSGNTPDQWEQVKIPLLDENMQSIWEDKIPTEEALRMQNKSPFEFWGQYMQEPAPLEGGIIKKGWFDIINKEKASGKKEVWVDGAYTKNTKNDPTGLMTTSFYNNKLIIWDFTEKWMELSDLIEYIPSYFDVNSLTPHTTVNVEPKASGKDIASLIRRHHRSPVIEITTQFVKVSKEERMHTISDYIRAGNVVLIDGAWNELFINYLIRFPNAKHDEACDLLAYAVEKCLIKRNDIAIYY